MPTHQEAAATRAAAAKKSEAAARVTALEEERRGYVTRGDTDRVTAVDEEIDRWSKVAAGEDSDAEQADDAEQPDDAEQADGEQEQQTEPQAPPARRGRAKAAAAGEPEKD